MHRGHLYVKARSLCASEVGDMLSLVSADPDDAETRGRTLPKELMPTWWAESVRKALKDNGHDQQWLAEQLGVDPPRVSKVLTYKVPTLELIIAISNLVHVPLPVVIADTEAEALAIDGTRRMFRLKSRAKAQVPGTKTGVGASVSEDQTGAVKPVHASSEGRRGKPR